MISVFKDYTGFLVIASLFFVLGVARMNDLSLYTDCTRYLICGNSLAHAKGFVDTTQPEPEYFVINAPFFSVILAPVLLFFPLSLFAAKVWTLLLGIVALFLFYYWLKTYFGKTPALVSTLLFALNPLTLVLSTEVLSETSFLCALFGIFILLDEMEQDGKSRWNILIFIVILSLVMLLREVGVGLVGAAIIFLLIKKQKRTALLAGICTTFLFALWTYRNLSVASNLENTQNTNLYFIFRHFVTSPETSILHEFAQRIFLNIQSYSIELCGMLFYPFPFVLIVAPSTLFGALVAVLSSMKYFTAIVFFPMIVMGIFYDFKTSKTALLRLLFLLLYLCIVLIYPVQDIRFLFPLLPLIIFFIVLACKNTLHHLCVSSTIRHTLIFLLVGIACIPNVVCIFEILRTNLVYVSDPVNFEPEHARPSSSTNYFSIPWKILGTSINKEIPSGAFIVSPDKEIVAFAERQKFLELNHAVPMPFFESFLRDNAAEYLLAPLIAEDLTEYQTNIDESQRFRFVRLHHINKAAIYRIESRLEVHMPDSLGTHAESETNSFSHCLRKGRRALLKERYSEADSIFSQLHSRYPHRADILYQLLLVHTFTFDSARANQDLQHLYTLPKSTSYTAPAQAHIYAMQSFLHSQSISDSSRRAEDVHEIGRQYWNLGYNQQAYHMMQRAVQLDTTFFVGILWAMHYSTQLDDTIGANEYLVRLERIDRENPLVKSYKTITLCEENLRQSPEHKKRSELHLTLSREYNAMNLLEEALDEAQRAIGEYPSNGEAWYHLAGLFEKKSKPLAAHRALQQASLLAIPSSAGSRLSPAKK